MLLALSVAYGHAGNFLGFRLVPGDTAVQAFYAISGFYMGLVLNERYRPEHSTYWLFIGNRFVRLLPTYLLVLLATLTAAIILTRRGTDLPFVQSWQSLPDLSLADMAYLVGSQVALIGEDLYMFLTVQHGSLHWVANFYSDPRPLFQLLVIPPAWSLGVEVWFYLLAPFIVRRPFGQIVFLLFGSVALRMILQFGFGLAGDPWSYRFFPCELALFLCGALAYQVYRQRENGRGRSLLIPFGACCLALVAALLINRWSGMTRVASLGMLLAMMLAIPFFFQWTRRSAVDRVIGELSYPLYICHSLVIWTVGSLFAVPSVGRGLVVMAAALCLSWILYWLIDRPFDAWRHSRLRPKAPAVQGAISVPTVAQ